MTSQSVELFLTISPPQDADEQEIAELNQQLRVAVLESDADTVEHLRGGAAPPGAKGEPLTLAALLVMIAPKAVDGLIQIIQNWVSRHERVAVSVKRGDTEIKITGEPSAEQQQFAAALVASLKH
jgi:Effector Associated Constant Component 1